MNRIRAIIRTPLRDIYHQRANIKVRPYVVRAWERGEGLAYLIPVILNPSITRLTGMMKNLVEILRRFLRMTDYYYLLLTTDYLLN
jgi:hypothetical protein